MIKKMTHEQLTNKLLLDAVKDAEKLHRGLDAMTGNRDKLSKELSQKTDELWMSNRDLSRAIMLLGDSALRKIKNIPDSDVKKWQGRVAAYLVTQRRKK